MNIFRLTGDLSHLAAIIILLLKIWKTRSCAGKRPVDPRIPDTHVYIPAFANVAGHVHLLLCWLAYADVNSGFPIHLDEQANRGEMHPSDIVSSLYSTLRTTKALLRLNIGYICTLPVNQCCIPRPAVLRTLCMLIHQPVSYTPSQLAS